MSLFAKSLLLIAGIPLLSLAIEPTNPEGICGRFIGEKDMEICRQRTQKEDIDWYALSACNLQKEDSAFWNCWDRVKGKSFDPRSLTVCTESEDMSDDSRQACINGALANRKPASQGHHSPFQKIEIKKRGR
ncbi:MAG: hypothetical protein OM95_10205 [Bdellovibrio sp. ArHS]|uniref:hypothetical protein n=1 Tax=Bdellovibrio sp. ArHS TaxID=1569284 RepID=UPI0005824833|nr:hypothetical protein [Bdellovibrio sp. ArHS]KHD88140.1 MAG: hypothetical protein OM95_10205 [Bdellovibrio sp. ArHS]